MIFTEELDELYSKSLHFWHDLDVVEWSCLIERIRDSLCLKQCGHDTSLSGSTIDKYIQRFDVIAVWLDKSFKAFPSGLSTKYATRRTTVGTDRLI